MNGKAPDVDLRRPELGALLGDHQVVRERDAERAGQHVAVGGADRRLAELADQAEQLDEALGAEVLVHERHVAREAAQVGARGEHALVRRGEHDAARGVVVAGGLVGVDQLAEQLVRQRVARVRLVQRDRRDAVVVDVEEDRLVGQAVLRRKWEVPLPTLTKSAPRPQGGGSRAPATRRCFRRLASRCSGVYRRGERPGSAGAPPLTTCIVRAA